MKSFKPEGAAVAQDNWFKVKDGKKYARVTAVLGAVNPCEYRVTEEQLKQYGAMGTIIHKMAEMALTNDTDVTSLYLECAKEWELVQNGSLKLDPSAANPRGFMKAYPEFDWKHPIEIEKEWFNDELMLSGTADLIIKYNGVLSIADWKTSRSYSQEKKEHYFKQLAAYAMLSGLKINALVICPLNPKNNNGYGKPIHTIEVEKYKKMYLADLDKFNKLYRK